MLTTVFNVVLALACILLLLINCFCGIVLLHHKAFGRTNLPILFFYNSVCCVIILVLIVYFPTVLYLLCLSNSVLITYLLFGNHTKR
jgi:uncharacterized membrane protein